MKWIVALALKLVGVGAALAIVAKHLDRFLQGRHLGWLVAAVVFACPNRWILWRRRNTIAYLAVYASIILAVLYQLISDPYLSFGNWQHGGDIYSPENLLLLATPGLSLLAARKKRGPAITPASADSPTAAPLAEIEAALNSADPTEKEWAEAEMQRIQAAESGTAESSPLPEEGDGVSLELGFSPLAFAYGFCTPTVEIDGAPHTASWGNQFVELSPGAHTLTVYFAYPLRPRCGANSIQVNIEPGKKCMVEYRMPPWIFAKGSIRLNA